MTLALRADGQDLTFRVNLVAGAVVPAALKDVALILPSGTVRAAPPMSTTQAVAVMEPVKLMTPSAAKAAEADRKVVAARVVTNNVFFMSIIP
ncbi:hypothetical protein D3C71_1652720 [compost metagenome]